MSVTYTKEQNQAIKMTGTNLLVSASAGSGKTTVLIERILHKIINEKCNVDEILVVTFTEAAASELKLRLRLKITKALLEQPRNKHLRKQLPKLANAHIATFHSFCNEVIKKFFYLIDFDATYKIGDDVEIFMIAKLTLDQLFEDCFERDDEKFKLIVERFSTKTHDDALLQLIIDLYFKMRSLPFKKQFKQGVLQKYHHQDDITTWAYYDLMKESIQEKLKEAKNLFTKAYLLASQFGHQYIEQYEDDVKLIDNIEKQLETSFDDVHQYLKIVKFNTFRSNCEEIDQMSKEMIKEYRDRAKKIVMNDLAKKYFPYKGKSQLRFLTENKKVLEALFYFIDLFDSHFKDAKRDKNLVDFNDLEELTLKILLLNQNQNEATIYYRQLFKEIFIDEFQDTNSMQETIMKLIANGNNLFMVGDVKQSIYRFRSAEPDIFQQKYKQYQMNQGGKLINLNANYRSRHEILGYINYLFYQLMDEDCFEIDYDDDACLKFGQKDYLKNKLEDTFVHLHLIDKHKLQESRENTIEKSEIEAHYVAKQIRNLIDHQALVYDKQLLDVRPIQYRDIVILSRTKNEQNTYHDIFKQYNIPFLTTELSGYFDSIEVLTITSILKVIDNPLQDIPLVATLRSPIFQMNEKELIEIKINSHKDYFYDKIIDYLKIGKNITIISKLKTFVKQLNNWREHVKNEPLSELLFSIYHETNYYDFVLGQIGGKQRQANLDLLFERAKLYEQFISNSLFKFIQLINFLNENEKDLPQARTLSDNEDLVRFMTIHKSKGLEFPVVFVTNLNKKYNIEDEKSPVLFEKDFGLAFQYMDIMHRVKYDTLYQQLLKDKLRKQMLAEELRLLYVALTRAKERLYLIGCVDDFDEEKKKLKQLSSIDDVILPKEERQSLNYLDLILKAMARHKEFHRLLQQCIETKFHQKIMTPSCNVKIITSVDEENIENHHDATYEIDFSKYTKEISKRLNYTYPYNEKTNHFAKQTIADMKRANQISEYQYHHEKSILKKPKFIDKKENATLRGTSYHIFMQHLDYHQDYSIEHLKQLKNKLLVEGIMNDEQIDLIDLSKIESFLNSEVAQKIKKSHKINKEMPFTTLVNGKTVYHDLKDEVDILLQGVVDLLVEFKDTCVLIDFKSDRIENSKTAINRLKRQYQIQIDVYKEAMQNIYKHHSIEAYLYLFEINQLIKM